MTSNNSQKSKVKIEADDILGYAGIGIMSAGFFGVYAPLGFIVLGACLFWMALHYPQQKSDEG